MARATHEQVRRHVWRGCHSVRAGDEAMIARLKLWLAAAGAVVLAIAGTALTFWLKGRKVGRDAAAGDVAMAKTKAAVSDEVATQLEARMKNDAKVKALDSAPTPAAADAAVDSNLGGWLRDDDETSE